MTRKPKNWRKVFGVGPKAKDTIEGKVIISDAGAFKVKPTNAMMPEVFKLQWPQYTMEVEPKILVYNESRKWQGMIPITPELEKLFEGRKKIYVIATPDATGALDISHTIVGPTW